MKMKKKEWLSTSCDCFLFTIGHISAKVKTGFQRGDVFVRYLFSVMQGSGFVGDTCLVAKVLFTVKLRV